MGFASHWRISHSVRGNESVNMSLQRKTRYEYKDLCCIVGREYLRPEEAAISRVGFDSAQREVPGLGTRSYPFD